MDAHAHNDATCTSCRTRAITQLLQNGGVEEGRRQLLVWIGEGTAVPVTWQLLAFAHSLEGDPAAVLHTLDTRPDPPAEEEDWAFRLRVGALLKTEGTDAATSYVNETLERRPDFFEARRMWAATFEGHALPEHEMQALQILAREPDDPFALAAMARIEFGRGRWNESLRYAWRAIGNGANWVVWMVVGSDYLAMGNDREADKAFSRGIAGAPPEVDAERKVAVHAIGALELSGRFQDAEAMARVFLTDFEEDGAVFRALARARWRAGDPGEAKALAERAAALDGGERASAVILALAAADEGDLEGATRLVGIAQEGATRLIDRFPEVYAAWRLGLVGSEELLDDYEREVPWDPDLRWMRQRGPLERDLKGS